MRSDVGDVRDSAVVRLVILELPLKLVRSHLRGLAHLILGALVTSHRFDLCCSHQTSNTVFTAIHTFLLEIKEDAWAALDAHALVV